MLATAISQMSKSTQHSPQSGHFTEWGGGRYQRRRGAVTYYVIILSCKTHAYGKDNISVEQLPLLTNPTEEERISRHSI